MRGRIPEDVLLQVRERANIVEVVGAHVGLRRVGRNHVGLCPFHAEKTPSFTVNEDRGIFHCFGCGAGGNVFSFLTRLEALPFPEIVERLARRYGVTLPERDEDDPALRQREGLFRLNEQAARFFQRVLWDSTAAAPARAYLEERGIGREVSERFLLGYAPAGSDVLVRKLRAGGRFLESAVQLGLVAERRDKGGHYDRFRARLMFPITDSSGRVVGFGSRSVPGTPSAGGDLPKYINSPETPLYRKGAHLYGLALARDAIRRADRALVVEGYFDVLALAQAGIGHVVASLGTALTLAQLQVLKRFTRNVIAFFDGDAAGQAAAEKSLPTFLEAGLWGHAAFLPAGDDPDTFVRREGQDAALALLARATPLLEFYLDRAVVPTSTPAERAQVAQRVAGWLGKIGDPFEYDITVRRAAEHLGLGEEMLRRQPVRAAGRPATPATTKAPGPEALLVELMLANPAAIARVDAGDGVALFTDPLFRSLADEIVATARRGDPVDPATLLSRLDDATAARIAGRLLEDTTTDGDGRDVTLTKLVDDCLAKLRADATLPVRQALLRRIRVAEMDGDVAAVEEAQRELEQVKRSAAR
ncbi:MAG: DNA primase [Deltaproteobacteria bacterium]|nr:DNA primase [Deltaproteobacteria bacterium]